MTRVRRLTAHHCLRLSEIRVLGHRTELVDGLIVCGRYGIGLNPAPLTAGPAPVDAAPGS
jgi:hypothetical protein